MTDGGGAIKFGTDGWRALMTTDFTIEYVAIVAQAYADYLKESFPGNAPAKIVIGYDFRRNSEIFAKRFAEVLVGNRVTVLLSDRQGFVFATTSHEHMKKTLARAGFVRKGKEWKGKTGGLSLWTRP